MSIIIPVISLALSPFLLAFCGLLWWRHDNYQDEGSILRRPSITFLSELRKETVDPIITESNASSSSQSPSDDEEEDREEEIPPSPLFSHLPNELIHRIFSLSASSSPSTSRSLTSVSTWARTIALPYHFPTLTLRSAHDPVDFLRHSKHTTLPPFTQFTHNLWIGPNTTPGRTGYARMWMHKIMERCPNVRNVAFPLDCLVALVERSTTATTMVSVEIMPSRMMDFDKGLLSSDGGEKMKDHPILRGITRFILHPHPSESSISTTAAVPSFSAFPSLTHLAVGLEYAPEEWFHKLIASIQKTTPTLEMLVVLTMNTELHDWAMEERKKDERLHILDRKEHWFEQNWLGEEDIWEKAVEFTQRYRAPPSLQPLRNGFGWWIIDGGEGPNGEDGRLYVNDQGIARRMSDGKIRIFKKHRS